MNKAGLVEAVNASACTFVVPRVAFTASTSPALVSDMQARDLARKQHIDLPRAPLLGLHRQKDILFDLHIGPVVHLRNDLLNEVALDGRGGDALPPLPFGR